MPPVSGPAVKTPSASSHRTGSEHRRCVSDDRAGIPDARVGGIRTMDRIGPAALAQHHRRRHRTVSAHGDAMPCHLPVHALPIHPAYAVEHQPVQALGRALRKVVRHIGGCDEHRVVSFAGLGQNAGEIDGRTRRLVPHDDRHDTRVGIDVLYERKLDLDGMLGRMERRIVPDLRGQATAYLVMYGHLAQRRGIRFPAEHRSRAYAAMVRTYDDVGIGPPVFCEHPERVGGARPRIDISRVGHHDPAYAAIARASGRSP